MTTNEIYQLWFSKTKDLRYLRPKRWSQIRKLIESQQLKTVLEFGSGISTLLFDNLGLKVLSFETNEGHMKFVKRLCSPKVLFTLWDNKNLHIQGIHDIAFVDGGLPRTDQFRIAAKHSKFLIIDDFATKIKNELMPKLTNYKRLDDESTILAIFKKRF